LPVSMWRAGGAKSLEQVLQFIGKTIQENLVLGAQVRPDLVFGASTGTVDWDRFGGEEERSFGDVVALGELVGDGFEIGFDEAHFADEDGAVGVDEKNGGDHGEAVGVGDDIAFFFRIEKDRESDAVFLVEGRGFFGAVLRNADDGEGGGFIALVEAFEKRECELANGAADFKEGEKDRAFFEGGGERKLFAVEGFEREVWREIAGGDVGHAGFGSEETRNVAKDRHNQILAHCGRARAIESVSGVLCRRADGHSGFGVLYVVFGGVESFGGFLLGVGVWFEERDGIAEGHGFAVGWTGARVGDIGGFDAGDIPFEACEFHGKRFGGVNDGDASLQRFEGGTFVLEISVLFENTLRLKLAGKFLFEFFVGSELVVGGFGAVVDELTRIIFGGIVPGGGRRFVVLRRLRESGWNGEERNEREARDFRRGRHGYLSEGWCGTKGILAGKVSRAYWGHLRCAVFGNRRL